MAMGNAVWTPRQYDKLTEVAYRKNVVGYRAVTLISRAFSGIPIGLYEPDGDEVESHPVLDLLRKPNPWQNGRAFMEAYAGFYCLSGNAYVEGVDNNLDPEDRTEGPDAGKPLELYTHRPDRITIKLAPNGNPQAYCYKANGSEREWLVDPTDASGPLLHVRSFNPLNDFYGMSPIEACAFSVDTHNESSAWNKSLLQNGARPTGALIYKPQGVIGATMTNDQYQLLKDQLESKMTGPENAGMPLIMDGGMEWQEMGLSPKDMDWLQGRNNSAREIAQAFGVPPQMLGIPGDNTYANYAEARASLYEDTVIPVGESLVEALSNWLLPAYGLQGYQLRLELDDISALFPRRKEKWDMVNASQILTINEKRRELGYDAISSPLADELLIPSGFVPLDDLGAVEEPEAKPESNEDPAEAKAINRLRNGFNLLRGSK